MSDQMSVKGEKGKWLEYGEIKKLRQSTKRIRDLAIKNKNRRHEILEWFLCEVGFETGLRIQEIADLRCGDWFIKDGIFYIIVRKGKGGKKAEVICSKKFKDSFFWYLKWKRKNNEPIDDDSPLFYSPLTGTNMTKRALQKAFKRALEKAGLSKKYSTHSMRRSYGTSLHRISKDLEIVRKQLRHESITTTQLYITTDSKIISKYVEMLYKDKLV